MKYIIKISLILALLNISLFSCNKDRLNVPPLGALSESEIANKRGVENLLIGAYSLLDGSNVTPSWGSASSNWIFGSICGSEAYKGSDELDQLEITSIAQFTTLPTNPDVADKWKAVYWGVQRANDVFRLCQQ